MIDRRRLPPLNLLRGFEAAARHLSFTLAADELFVTQGAVSRQIRELERFLGKPLFYRMTRRIALTKEGEELYRVVDSAFIDLERITAGFHQKPKHLLLTVSILPTLSTLWLMPRLHLFTQQHPNVEVTTISSIEPANMLAHEADVAVRVGSLPGQRYERWHPRIALEMVTDWSGVQAEELFPDVLIPVCTPALLKGQRSIVPQDIVHFPLIHTSTRPDAWSDWLTGHNVNFTKPLKYALEFGHFFMSLDAARQGLGIAIIPQPILAAYSSGDELVTPLSRDSQKFLESAGKYYLLVHEERRHLEHVQHFRNWLLSEAALLQSNRTMKSASEDTAG